MPPFSCDRLRYAPAALAFCLGLAAGSTAAPAQEPEGDGGIAYATEITGVESADLRDLLTESSRLVALQKDPPPSILGLRRRADTDRERLAAALRSEGHYKASLEIAVDATTTPAKAVVTVDPGPRYTIADVVVRTPDGGPPPGDPISPDELMLPIGSPARGPAVAAAGDALPAIMARRAHARARLVDRIAEVDHAAHTMRVTYTVDPGPAVLMGDLRISGLEDVSEGAVRRRAAFKPGTRYDPALLERTREALADLGVFSGIRLRLAEEPGPDGLTPVEVAVQERLPRFIGFGVSYGTRDGVAANVEWGHRNLLGGAERFRVFGTVAGVGRQDFTDPGAFDYRVGAAFTERDFLTRAQKLDLAVEAISERPEAYRRNAVVLSGIVTRPIATGLTGSLGLTFEQSRVDDGVVATTNTLVGVPGALTFDRTDDPLNPRRGFRLSAAATPYASVLGDGGSFVVGRLGGSTYFDFSGDGSLIGAVRGTYGAVVGLGGLFDVPADKRFYAGGGGSIRGYGYQEVGPQDPDGAPLGGLSLLETSAEIRYRLTETVGLVAFIDGGNVYRSEYPQLNEELRWGAGLGVRYFTMIGPIRADFGIPLNRRPGDSSWAVYVSIGQAF